MVTDANRNTTEATVWLLLPLTMVFISLHITTESLIMIYVDGLHVFFFFYRTADIFVVVVVVAVSIFL